MIEYKLVNAIANVESNAGGGSQGGSGSDGGHGSGGGSSSGTMKVGFKWLLAISRILNVHFAKTRTLN